MAEYRQILSVLGAAALAAVFTGLLTPVVRRLAVRHGFVDVPRDSRRMHCRPVPNVGGVAIVAVFAALCLILGRRSRIELGILAGGLVIALLGFLDDRFDIPARYKLLVQIVAACIPVSQGCLISWIGLTGHTHMCLGMFQVPVTMLWIVAVTNAVNFIDGLDGLSSGICALSSLGMILLLLWMGREEEALLSGILLGCCLGFLPHNWNPAKIFMGDTGATFLGFVLACLCAQGFYGRNAGVSPAVALLVLGVPLSDLCYACLRRIKHHVSPMHPDRGHMHHMLVDVSGSQCRSVLALYGVQLLLCTGAVAGGILGPLPAMGILLILAAAEGALLCRLSRSVGAGIRK